MLNKTYLLNYEHSLPGGVVGITSVVVSMGPVIYAIKYSCNQTCVINETEWKLL